MSLPPTPPLTFIAGCIVPAAYIDSAAATSDDEYLKVDVTLRDGLVASIERAGTHLSPPEALRIDGSDRLLLPGTVNAHAHTCEHWARGLIKPLPLELWVDALMRHEPRGEVGGAALGHSDPFLETPSELIGLSCLHAGVETLLGGATALMDHLWARGIEDIRCAVNAYKSLGIRVWLAPMLGDASDDMASYAAYPPNAVERNADAAAKGFSPGGLGVDGSFRVAPNGFDSAQTDRAVALWEEAVALFHRPDEGINIAIGPITCFAASRELIRRGAELRKKHGLAGHIHVLETQSQALQSRELFPEGGCVQMLRDTGFLQLPGTSLAHCVWLSDAEVSIVAEAGATIVHNPASNLRLGSGVAPVRAYLDAGINVALGADGACSSDAQDMCEAMKLACLVSTLHTREYRTWLTPREVHRMASEGGYAGVGMAGRGGVLRVGAEADLVLYDLTALSMLPIANPLGSLVLGRPSGGPGGDALLYAWVRGRPIIAEGRFTTVDLAKLRADIRAAYPSVRSSATTDPGAHPSSAALEREYRSVVGLEGSVRPADPAEAARLADGYPAGRTLDDRRSLP